MAKKTNKQGVSSEPAVDEFVKNDSVQSKDDFVADFFARHRIQRTCNTSK
jgi:hypothetical protein